MIRRHSGERTIRSILLIAGDCAIAMFVIIGTVQFRRHFDVPGTEGLLPPSKFPLDVVNVGTAMATLVVALAANGFYAERTTRRHRPMIALALVAQVLLLTLVSTLLQRPYPRTILVAQPLFESGLLIAWRRFFAMVLPVRMRRTLLVGPPARVSEFMALLAPQQERRIEFVGFVGTASNGAPAEAPTGAPLPRLGNLDDEPALAALRQVEEVIALSDHPHDRLRLFEIRGPAGYLAVPSHADALLASPNFAWVGDQPLIEIAARSAIGAAQTIKRLFDIVVAALLLLIFSPLMALIALVIIFESGFPVVLSQSRVGRSGKRFLMRKFRTMYGNRDEGSYSAALASEDDARVTPIGNWLRRHRLDELPQLVNVLRGEMSLVGPRPERADIHDQLCRVVEGFGLRLLVQPGATGLAQVWSDYETTPATKLRYDLSYICGWSPWLDARILLQSISTATSGRGL